MPTTFFICDGCHLEKPANPRLKGNQKYCEDPKCQRLRKRVWQKQALASDTIYRTKQSAGLTKWRQERPLDRYQKQYRENHPKYVEKNREKQKIRNQQRRHQAAEKIVKMDALPNPLIISGIYMMTPCEMDASGMIVKMDAFLVELKAFQGDSRYAFAAAA